MGNRISFEDKKAINDTIHKLMQMGFSEKDAREQVAKWVRDTPIKNVKRGN